MPHPGCTDGLYDPRFEHDACGVGFLCHLSNEPSHRIVQQGLDLLVRLAHRGACGCDARTGDGAGILIQVPHAFFAARCPQIGIELPEAGQYGVGMVFLPQEVEPRAQLQALFEQIVAEEGQDFLGWRAVPTDAIQLGTVARAAEPTMWHAFVGNTGLDRTAFERKLYVIRKIAEHRARTMQESDTFYIASLSTRTLVYKGMLMTDQLGPYFPDLADPLMASAMAMVHSRFATNTLPRWPLAQPFRFLSHNGEINTLRGNVNWMKAREAVFHSDRFGDDMQKLLPVLNEAGSDSLILDNALELLYFTGRSLPHAMMMLVPEAWEHHEAMDDDRRAFYEYHACLMEPWDGPATLPFTDGRYLGAMLDRNGLRPSRYTITKDGYVVLASEAGVLNVDPANVQEKGRLQPGHMFLVDLEEHRVVPDEEIKAKMAGRQPYRQWLNDHLVKLKDLPVPSDVPKTDPSARTTLRRLFGYTLEDLRLILGPMGRDAKEPLGSMGNDTALAVLSDQSRPLYDYFKQRFAQVTNPPLDAIREEIITSLYLFLGGEGDLFQETPQHARQVRLHQPILTNADLARLRAFDRNPLRTITLDATFDPSGEGRLASALERLSKQASEMVTNSYGLLILSDRKAGRKRAPIPALLAIGAVHHHLIRTKQRTRCSLIVESGEPREVHHLAALIGYGASAINPYLALDSVRELAERGDLGDVGREEAEAHFIKAAGKGLLKVLSKMGISTLQSYHGAQIFEAVGLADDVVDRYFTGTISRIGGIGLEEIGEEMRINHRAAFPPVPVDGMLDLPVGGRYQWRRGGEHHVFNPMTVATL
ncbi:MAG TPA: glutamate synthase central domain-containing protein, partial [Rhodothermales bacterium]|nr:glutamate synthase central domain-containing protein [Rhodothermales bacterium]